MISKLLILFLVLFSLLFIKSQELYAGTMPIGLGEGDGCSALSKPDIDCSDLNISSLGPAEFCGTMGKKGIVVRLNQSNDADTDGESNGVEACICDALDNNPNININPGDGSVCDSSIPALRDQFFGNLELGLQLQGQKFEFCYTFTRFPSTICPQTE